MFFMISNECNAPPTRFGVRNERREPFDRVVFLR